MHLKIPAFSILAPLCSGAKTSAVSKVQVRILGSASEAWIGWELRCGGFRLGVAEGVP